MKVQFNTTKRANPDKEAGIQVPYAAAKRGAYKLRWNLILLLAISPVIILVWLGYLNVLNLG